MPPPPARAPEGTSMLTAKRARAGRKSLTVLGHRFGEIVGTGYSFCRPAGLADGLATKGVRPHLCGELAPRNSWFPRSPLFHGETRQWVLISRKDTQNLPLTQRSYCKKCCTSLCNGLCSV